MSKDSRSAWYADFFTELPNAFWRAVVPSELTAAEVDFVIRVGGLPPAAHVLDAPCGSGRHSLELARRGFRVTGVDVSAEALAFAERAAADERLPVTLIEADMKTPPAHLRADAAICMGNSFGYLEHEDTSRMLAGLHEAVQPGGCLVIDYGAAAEALLPHLKEELPMSADGIEVEATNVYDAPAGRLSTSFTFRRGGQEHRGTSVQHVYTAAEVARLTSGAGFTDIRMYADTDGTAFTLGSPRLLLVAHRA
ncbi:methyltransferase domain-containing protein [Streptomyces sp. NPDC047108]|uniref:class I SAM-dependent methyltransferase n=1 Tax=Streptomyces sp. NPDC047108 TaxID=3155025 RepID=UPI0033CBC524